jgi:hypothetical protein
VVRIEPQDPSEQHPEWGPRLKWVFYLADYSNPSAPMYGQDGEPYEFWQTTSTKLSPKSTARPWVEALLARQLGANESGAEIAAALPGKKAVVMIGPNAEGYTRILSIQPMKAPAAKAATAPAAVATLEEDLPPAQRSAVAMADPEIF